MIVQLLTEHHLEFLSLKGGCRGSSESTHVKMPHCWKSHVTAHLFWSIFLNNSGICNILLHIPHTTVLYVGYAYILMKSYGVVTL